ncbi:hypothetical protein D3C71_1829540 [compost metagenome]
MVFRERVTALGAARTQARFNDRVVRRRERQLVDGHQGQHVARQVDAFPETGATHQHRVLQLAKAVQQIAARALALFQERPVMAGVIKSIGQQGGHFFHGA